MWTLVRAILRRILSFLRDQAWGGIAGIVAVLTLISSLLAFFPRFAPVRTGIAQAIAGTTPTLTVVVLTPTPTIVAPTATALVPSPTTPPSFDSLAPYNSATTLVPNWRFDCNGCDQPFLVTVTQVSIDVAAQNMVWSLSIYNHTAQTVQAEFFSLRLTDPDDVAHDATGPILQNSTNVTAGQTLQVQVTFAFVPKHSGAYSLTASLYNGIQSPTAYGPQTITF